METITLQMLELQLTNYKKLDLQKKVDIIINIVKKCKHIRDELYDNLEKVADLTGVSSDTLLQIKQLEDTSRKFEDWLVQKTPVVNHQMYHKVNTYLRHCYTQKFSIPSKKYIKDIFHANNFENYFTSIELPGLKKSIVVEKPELVLKRHRFLYTKLMCKEAGKNMVYIESTSLFNKSGNLRLVKHFNEKRTSGFILAVSPRTGFVNSIFSCGADARNLANWLSEHVIPNLPPSSVLVIQDNLMGKKFTIPTINTSKEEMSYWLQIHDIAHDLNMHRGELFLLIQKFKKTTCEMTNLEKLVRAAGHTVLFREEGMFDFDVLEPFWQDLIKKLRRKFKSEVNLSKNAIPYIAAEIAKSMEVEYWKKLEKTILKAELDLYKSDMEMEEVIDKLMTMTSSEGLPEEFDETLDSHCKATEQEYIFAAFS